MQARALLNEARARSEAALLGATRYAASGELRAIQRAQGAAEALAQSAPRLDDNPETCIAMMKRLVDASGVFSFAGLYDLNGHAECSSAGPMDFGRTASLDAAIANPVPTVRMNQNPPVSQGSVLFARHPVFDDDGTLVGFASVSVPHSALKPEDREDGEALPLMLLTFNAEGDVITSSIGFENHAGNLPRDRSLKAFVSSRAFAFTALSNDGLDRTFSVVPLVPETLYALGSWPADALPPSTSLSALPPVAVPALMWIVSLGVALVAAERLVTRHIKKLTRGITNFARGNRTIGALDFADAPEEIRAAGDAFETMTAAILHNETELESMVHQKEVLLREVHHRVKNNLQLIASIMNMQARRAHTPETKAIVRRLQDRVMSLATIHRGLYQTSGLADVRADELLQDILRQIVNMASGPGHRFDVEQEFAPVRITPDQAVPLALLVTEALTNAMKYGGGENGRGRLTVRLEAIGEAECRLLVSNTTDGSGAENDVGTDGTPTGLGTQLVAAFVDQLEGTAERHATDGEYRLSVRFPLRPLAGGEARVSKEDPDETSEAAE